ncbi:FAD-binding oxidoreductase [Actinoplanes sp. TBRC 11911]|uniref:FAD-binding oxidoreductase n=1 Tax=Actinoplanes sp. TBRC 11911 TaxID=2729386 RepID=UPI00145D3C1C|nr:FAD-binding oxidoreductase [Actinoplanes sp. TBRC 11911]NMO49740.1 FAD-binding oxidoreductase [Actinoplanes sp. TBRC 11911]
MIIDSADLDALTAEVAGPVLTPGDEGYEEETAAWNQAVPQHPAVVVGATGVADVQAAVRFAEARNLPIAVLATGHGALIPSDGALLINLRRLDGIVIDAAARTATVGGGAVVQSLVEKAAAAGLAPIVGSNVTVGVVGLTLGGGLSPVLGRTYGFAADHVRSVEIVTPDGEKRHVDATAFPDLFWALRGGKGNFGVVTALTIDLFPVTRLYGGGLYYAGEDATEVLAAFRRLLANTPREFTTSVAFLRLPPVPELPEPLRGRLSVHVRIAYLGSAEDGEALVADLRAAAPPVVDTVAEMPYTAIGSIHAEPVRPVPGYGIATLLSDFPAEAADRLVDAAGPGSGTSISLIEIRQLGGAMAEAPATPDAVGNRAAPFQFFAGTDGEPGMAESIHPRLAEMMGALASWDTGRRSVNFMEVFDVAPEVVATGYDPEAYERLTQIKHRYDPKNLFRINQNISDVAAA